MQAITYGVNDVFGGFVMGAAAGIAAGSAARVLSIVQSKITGHPSESPIDSAAWSSLVGACLLIENLDAPYHTSLVKLGAVLSTVSLGAFFGSKIFQIGNIPAQEIDGRGESFCRGWAAGAISSLVPFVMGAQVPSACLGFFVANSVSTLYVQDTPNPLLYLE